MSEKGDNSAYENGFGSKHIINSRLTTKGQWQLKTTGEWLKRAGLLRYAFDYYGVSETARAMESAACLNIDNAMWDTLTYLREQDTGELEGLNVDQRRQLISEYSESERASDFMFRFRGGESVCDIVENRVDRFLKEIKAIGYGRVLAVCHGKLMEAFRHRLLNETIGQWDRYAKVKNENRMILNGMLHAYSRVDPRNDSEISDDFSWFKAICPNSPNHLANTHTVFGHIDGWIQIEKPKYGNKELLSLASESKRLVDDPSFNQPFAPEEVMNFHR